MGNPWTDLVKKTFRLGKQTDASYSLKEAMVEAKKVYKKGSVILAPKRTRRKSSGGAKKRRRRTVSR